MNNKELTTLNIIRDLTKDIFIKCDVDGYRPIKNTSKEDCYEALYKIIYTLRKAEKGHGGSAHD